MAALKGVTNAQLVLGLKYFMGEGVARDYVQGYKWLYIAAQKGDERAQKGIKNNSVLMSQSQINEAIRLAKEEMIKLRNS